MDKKTGLLIGAALVSISSAVFAADTACDGTTGGDSSVTTGAFIVNGFTMKCSKNVHLSHLESATAVAVCAGSTKGNKMYGGSSEGGAVKESTAAYSGTAVTAVATTGC